MSGNKTRIKLTILQNTSAFRFLLFLHWSRGRGHRGRGTARHLPWRDKFLRWNRLDRASSHEPRSLLHGDDFPRDFGRLGDAKHHRRLGNLFQTSHSPDGSGCRCNVLVFSVAWFDLGRFFPWSRPRSRWIGRRIIRWGVQRHDLMWIRDGESPWMGDLAALQQLLEEQLQAQENMNSR